MNGHSPQNKSTLSKTALECDTRDKPPPPEPPSDDDCCNSGCEELCVFEIYRKQKAEYEAAWGS